jgi:DNA polymerase-1
MTNNIQNQTEQTAPTVAIQKLRYIDSISYYMTIDRPELFKALILQAAKFDEVAVDTETTGLDILTVSILGYSLSFESGKAFWIPIKSDPQLKNFQRITKSKLLIFFNANYDLAVIERHLGTQLPNKFVDVQIGCFFRDIENYKHNAGLKTQSHLILNVPVVELKELLLENAGKTPKAKIEIDFTQLADWQQRVYGCQDADITMQLWQHKEIQKAIATMPKIWDIEHELIRVVMQMHKNGIGIDLKLLAKFGDYINTECDKYRQLVIDLLLENPKSGQPIAKLDSETGQITFKNEELQRLTAKTGLNLGSPAQKSILLYEELELSGGPSTDAQSLERLADKHPLIPILQQYAKLSTRRSLYTKKLPELVHPITQRLHPSLWATGARTGRFSCSKPNLQAVSGDQEEKSQVQIRKVFVASKGNVLTVADYNQIELRIAASLSQERILIDAYNNNEDVHAKMACKLFGVQTPTPVQRHIAKTANFEILYGIGAKTMFQGHRDIIKSEAIAQKVIEDWLSALPRLRSWIEATKYRAHKQEFAKTLFGRIRPLPNINNPSQGLINEKMVDYRKESWAKDCTTQDLYEIATRSIIHGSERQAVSHVVQGTAADVMKQAMIRTSSAIDKSGLDIKMLLTVHDELLFEHPPKITKQVHKLIEEAMTVTKLSEGWVSLPVAIGTGQNWFEAKK